MTTRVTYENNTTHFQDLVVNAFIIIIVMSERAGRCTRPLYEYFTLQ